MSAPTFPVSVVFHSDWGVSTGVGVVGGVDAAVEKDERGLPVVRGTVLTGVVREQSVLAAQALDGNATGPWHKFASDLFGSEQAPRLVVFSDARVPEGAAAGRAPVHEIVSLSIDDDTGTAREDFLRFIERAGACALVGEAALVDVDADGRPLTWDEGRQRAAELLLALSGLLVRGIGSDRSNGDGACDVLIGAAVAAGEDVAAAAEAKRKVKTWCQEQVESWAAAAAGRRADSAPVPCAPRAEPDLDGEHRPRLGRAPATPAGPAVRAVSAPATPAASAPGAAPAPPATATPHAPGAAPAPGAVVSPAPGVPAESELVAMDLTIVLKTPVVSYEVPMSNEVRSLDFLRGTVLLPWVHRLLGRESGDPLVRDAVVNGDLLVSDAVAVVDDRVGLPMPLVLSTPKVSRAGREWIEVANRLLVEEPEEVHKPLRSGYVFPDPDLTSRPDPVGADGAEQCPPFAGWSGAPPLTGRQSTAHETATGAAKDGQLFLVRALPAGLTLRATVTMSPALHEHAGARLEGLAGKALDARIGARRLSGTFGRTLCTFSAARPLTPAKLVDAETTIWFTSDVLVRSSGLGPGGGLEDLRGAFEGAGVPIGLVDIPPGEKRFRAGVRHRRVDSWSAASHQPRATRMAVQAGSVLRIRTLADDAPRRLARLALTGVGELRAQGFGRFVVGHPLLERDWFRLATLRAKNFIAGAARTDAQEEQS
ncbi:hypothetical protein AM609_11525 [Actinomyces sp. oral taxon 414]|uniref:RAMP superfamily CRISPR-associated protein n=1 Tax=Actinomyces sp. oral taxon 414 TaxID=712122 RepID=UPI0006AEA4B4|nr:RAMP superfamily CRISPR-associated protein [Actinomyces sp. oral taxon 414]ALC99931.1 hypothetical protein AM609_11525 [Actinomyces sp. oral taxon 414]